MDSTTLRTDKLGREIKQGDTIAYPVRRGSKVDLKTAIVTGFTDCIEALTVGVDDRSINVKLRHPGRCVVVESN